MEENESKAVMEDFPPPKMGENESKAVMEDFNPPQNWEKMNQKLPTMSKNLHFQQCYTRMFMMLYA